MKSKSFVFKRLSFAAAHSFLGVAVVVSFLLGSAAFGQSLPRTGADQLRYDQINQFLLKTGFPDLSAAIAETLSKPSAQSLEKINLLTLQTNYQRMQIINHARVLAAELLFQLTPTISNQAQAEKTAEFTARLISQKRTAIPDAFPDAIRNIRNSNQRVAAKEQFIRGVLEKNMIRMQEQILSDALHTIYGRDRIAGILNGSDQNSKRELTNYIQHLDGLIANYVRALHFDFEMGQGHWLGEAMALGLVHASRLSKDATARNFEPLLAKRTFAYGEYLTDYMSNTLTFEDLDGKRQVLKINNADTITELNTKPWTSPIIAGASRPNIQNKLKAFKERLYQSLTLSIVAADEDKSVMAAVEGKEPTLKDKIRMYFKTLRGRSFGSSHNGMALVFKNEESGVAISRAVDLYSSDNLPYGGTRFVPTKSVFAAPGIFANIGVASLNPEKTLTYLQELTRKNGFQPVFKVSDVYRPNETGRLVKAENETFNWTPRITKEEQQEILKVPVKDANTWYEKVFAPNLAAEMLRYITDYGMVYHTFGEDPANKMSCYCSQGVNFAGFRETGHNLQSHPDKMHLGARIARIVYPKLKKFDTILAEKMIAANFMETDPKTTVQKAYYRQRGILESWTELFQAPRRDFDPALTIVLSPFVNRNLEYSRVQDAQLMYGPIAYLNAAEVTVAKNPNKAHKTSVEPRVQSMGPSTGDAPAYIYNPAPSPKFRAQLESDADFKLRRSKHAELLKVAGYANESAAAAFILAEMAPRMLDPDSMDFFLNFAAKMLALKPVNPPRLIPHEITAMTGNERELAIANYVEHYTAQQIETQTRQILSDAAGILYGGEAVAFATKNPNLAETQVLRKRLGELHALLGKEVRQIYLDQKASDARALGMNLVLGLSAFAFRSKAQSVSTLVESLKPYGLQWEDFFENPLDESTLRKAVTAGDYTVLKARALPGEKVRLRLSQPAKSGRKPRISELEQLKYSPYVEAQTDLTRALDVMFNSEPSAANSAFTQAERVGIFTRVVKEYMEPLNKEQLGNNGDIRSSGFLRANPLGPQSSATSPATGITSSMATSTQAPRPRPLPSSSMRTCEQLF